MEPKVKLLYDKMLEFKATEKCSGFGNPNTAIENSTHETKREINRMFNDAAKQLLNILKTKGEDKKEIEKVLKDVSNTSESDIIIDTEEHDYCFFVTRYLCEIFGFDPYEIIK